NRRRRSHFPPASPALALQPSQPNWQLARAPPAYTDSHRCTPRENRPQGGATGRGATRRAVNGVVSEFGPLRPSDEGRRCLEMLEQKFVHSAYRGGTTMSKRTAKAVAPGATAGAPATGLSADDQRHLAQIEKKFQVVRDRVVDVDMGYHH